ncbi:hypothetical protein CUMW_264220, partial [Citrus unshiu]
LCFKASSSCWEVHNLQLLRNGNCTLWPILAPGSQNLLNGTSQCKTLGSVLVHKGRRKKCFPLGVIQISFHTCSSERSSLHTQSHFDLSDGVGEKWCLCTFVDQ